MSLGLGRPLFTGRIHPAAFALAVAVHGGALAALTWTAPSSPESPAAPLTLETAVSMQEASPLVAEPVAALAEPETALPEAAAALLPSTVTPPPAIALPPPADAPAVPTAPPAAAVPLPPTPDPPPLAAQPLRPTPPSRPVPTRMPQPRPARPVVPSVRQESQAPPRPQSVQAPSLAAAPDPSAAAPWARPAQAAVPPGGGAISGDWRASLGTWLNSHRSYPDEARRRGEEGRAVIRFTASRDGRILDFTLVGSSGSEALDEAARAMFRNTRLPAFPASMDQAQVTVTVPIRFTLER